MLIVVDMLNDFLDAWEAARRARLVQAVNQLSNIVRGPGFPLLWVRQEFEPDLRDAFPEMRAKGIRPVILAVDCIDSYDREHHDVSLRYMQDKIALVRSNTELAADLGTIA